MEKAVKTKRIKRTVFISLLILISGTTMQVLSQAKFGQAPKGERLERIKESENYVNGEFKNIHETQVLTNENGRFRTMLGFMFRKKIRITPEEELPVIKTNLKALDPKEDILVWFGHSSYYFQLNGKTFLVDPVFSNYASPFSFINKAFKTSYQYNADDFPDIDYLLITHDHWDHLDYQSILDLKPKVKSVITGLGVGQHLEHWGFDNVLITELDWNESTELGKGWELTATPARHFSGRGLKRNQTLWASFVLQTPEFKLFIGGDGGYDTHFKEIGNKFGPFDLAILEQGQYDQNWNLIHLMPDLIFTAAKELQAKRILPVHHSKFALANHPWDEPLTKITENQNNQEIPVLTPQMGETVFLNDSTQQFTYWWTGLK